MPMREVRKKYTLSDIILLSWHSKQQAYNMTKRHNKSASKSDTNSTASFSSKITETATHYVMPSDLNNGVPIPKKFFNAKGDLDLRLATGPEACQYLRSLGLDLPPVIRT